MMIAAVDYVGLATLISALGAVTVGIIGALRQRSVAARVDDVHAAVTVSNGHTLGELVERNDARHQDTT